MYEIKRAAKEQLTEQKIVILVKKYVIKSYLLKVIKLVVNPFSSAKGGKKNIPQ